MLFTFFWNIKICCGCYGKWDRVLGKESYNFREIYFCDSDAKCCSAFQLYSVGLPGSWMPVCKVYVTSLGTLYLKVLALSLKPGTCLLNLCHSFKIHCSQFTLYSEMLLSSGKVGIGTIKESLYPFHWGLCFTWCILSTIHIYWQAWKYHVHEWNMYFLDITEWSILSAFIGTFSGK